ncbi:MAG: acyl-CoA synthetase [Hylemonella sp.]|nr:acyl-CoA synthetase [Hylemonella sp.]
MSTKRDANWTQQPERGSVGLMRLIAWIGLHLGRPTARVILYPICLYFMSFAPAPRRAGRAYLARVLGRPPSWGEQFRHIHTFASTILDRIFLLNDRLDLFEFRVHGEELAREASRCGQGRLVLGAHMGSFEAVRAIGHHNPDAPPVALLMYETNAQKMSRVMHAINPAATQEIIALGELDAMLRVQSRLAEGAFIGMLADRSFQSDEVRWLPLLGTPAPFPLGPFRLAALLRRPLLLMLGLYQGGNRYDIHFELLADFSRPGLDRQQSIEQALALYVARLEHHCRASPYNWFNFYDFWNTGHAPR